MKKVEIYTLNYCPYCKKALNTLKEQGIEYINIDSTENEEQISKELKGKYNIQGEVTYPQIIVDNVRFGGNDTLQNSILTGEFEKIFK